MAVVILPWLISIYGNLRFILCEDVFHRYDSIRSYMRGCACFVFWKGGGRFRLTSTVVRVGNVMPFLWGLDGRSGTLCEGLNQFVPVNNLGGLRWLFIPPKPGRRDVDDITAEFC